MLKNLIESFKYFKQIVARPLFSYASLLLLQLKVIWQIWDYKDLTSGDTSSYFYTAYLWFTDFANNIIWSPLYTSFFGSFLHITSDVYVATILHRLVIIFTVTTLVLALMRKLLPPGIAWVIAAWWAILPINFDTLYEVHLFAVTPILLACLVVTQRQTPLARGGAIAILTAASILVRNEFSLITIATVFICIIWELSQYIKLDNSYSLRQYIIGYAIPLITAGTLIFAFYNQSIVKFPELSVISTPKHTLNICQVYAFGYQQRYPGKWIGDPWTECQDLMRQKFGQDEPSLFQALMANPPEMFDHFRWNISLTLNGIQVSLFNATSGSVNPDYPPVILDSYWVIFPTLLIVLLSTTGITLVVKNYKFWWNFWLKERALTWLILISAASVAFFVIIPMQRPRPSYLFGLTLFLMAISGMSFFAITFDRPKFQFLSRFLPVLMILMLTFSQPYYINYHNTRPLLNLYRRFLPFQSEISHQDTVFLSREYSNELCSYLMKSEICYPLSYNNPDFWDQLSLEESLNTFLENLGVNLFYIDRSLWTKLADYPRALEFLENPSIFSWKVLALQDSRSDKWMLLKQLRTLSRIDDFANDLSNDDVNYDGIDPDGWVQKESFIDLVQRESDTSFIISGVIPEINDSRFSTHLTILIDDQIVFQYQLNIGEFNINFGVPRKAGNRHIKLNFSTHQQLPAPDQREVSARLYSIGFWSPSNSVGAIPHSLPQFWN